MGVRSGRRVVNLARRGGCEQRLLDEPLLAEVIVLTWLHQAQRDVLAVHPRDDPRNPETGVFSTRSQDRPNPIGLHRVHIAAIDGPRVLVRDLEAFDGTPILSRAGSDSHRKVGQFDMRY